MKLGYIHRDVKPGNMVIGLHGRDSRVIFLIDYGMVRSFVLKDDRNNSSIRKPRRKVLFRGIFRYFSINAHKRSEQGRVDDLWSLLYMLAECCIGLTWSKHNDEQQLFKLKGSFDDEEYSKRLPNEFRQISDHLKTLKYDSRPNYKEIYDCLMKGVKRLKTDFCVAYDWENEKDFIEQITTALSFSDPKMSKKPLTKEQLEWKLYPSTDPMRLEENVLGS